MHLLARQGGGPGPGREDATACCPGSARTPPAASPGGQTACFPVTVTQQRPPLGSRSAAVGLRWGRPGATLEMWLAGKVGGQGATRPRGERRALGAQDSRCHKGFAGLRCPERGDCEGLFSKSRLPSLVSRRSLFVRGLSCCSGFPLGASWGCSPVAVRRLLTAVAALAAGHGLLGAGASGAVAPRP